MRAKDDTPAGISRRDNDRDGTHGWTVSIQRRRQRVHRYFADREYGNRELAYQAACRCREELLQERPGFLRREIANLHRKSNTSGVPGVCRYLYD